MKLTLNVKHSLLIEQLEIIFTRFDVSCQRDILEEKTITEERRQARKATLEKFKGCLAKYGNNYNPAKGEWYEQ